MSAKTAYEVLIVQSRLPKKIDVCCNFSSSSETNILKGTVPSFEGVDTALTSSLSLGSVLKVQNQIQTFIPIKCLRLTYDGEVLFKGVPPNQDVSFIKYLIANVDENKNVTFSGIR